MSKKRRNRSGRSKRRSSYSSGPEWERLGYWLQLILIVVVPFVLVRGFNNYIDLPRGVLIQIAAVSILLVWLLGTISQDKLKIVRTPFDLPLLGLVFWAGLSLLWAHNFYQGFELWLQWSACLVFFFLTVNFVQTEGNTRRFLGALMIAGVLVAVLGVFQYLLEVDWVLQLRGPAATFGNRNMAAQFMVLTIPLAAVFFLLSRKRVHVLLTVVALGVLCLFLFYTSTRTAWLAVTVESLIFTVLLARDHFKWELAAPIEKKKKRALALCAVVVFVLINLTPSGFQWQVGTAYSRIRELLPGLAPQALQVSDRTSQVSLEGSAEAQPVQGAAPLGDSLSVRIRLWQNTLQMGKEHLVRGVGAGNFSVFYPRYARSAVVDPVFSGRGQWARAHNDYAQIFAELGVVGLFFLGWLLFALIKVFVALLGQETRGELRYLLLGVVVALGGLFISAFFSFPFQTVTVPFVFAIFLGVLGGHYSRQRLEGGNSVPGRKLSLLLPSWAGTAGAAFALLLLLILLPFESNRLRADWYFRRTDVAGQEKDWAAVISLAKQGYQYYPYRKDFLFRLGQAYFERGNLDAGIEATKEFLESYPYYLNAHHNVGQAYALKGEVDVALRHLNQVLEILPSYAKTHFAIAQLQAVQGDLDEALEHYRLALRGDDPDNSEYLVALGQAAFNKGLYQEAKDAFERAIETEPDSSPHYFKVGIAAARLRKFGEARVAFSKAVELDPKSAEAHYRLGMILIVFFKDREEGVQHLEQALSLNPSTPYAAQLRKVIEDERTE